MMWREIAAMWSDGWEGKALVCLGVFLTALIPAAIYGSIIDEREWQAFKTAHNCRIVGQTTSTTSTGFGTTVGPNGQVGMGPVVVSTPGKTGWACDDGITYWR